MKNLSCMDGTSGLLELEWQCPSCTLLNKAVSFKCRVCGTPKGTSTRQAKLVDEVLMIVLHWYYYRFHSAAIEKQYVAESLTKLQTLKHINKLSTVPSCPQTNISGRRRCSSKSRGDRSEINRWCVCTLHSFNYLL